MGDNAVIGNATTLTLTTHYNGSGHHAFGEVQEWQLYITLEIGLLTAPPEKGKEIFSKLKDFVTQEIING